MKSERRTSLIHHYKIKDLVILRLRCKIWLLWGLWESQKKSEDATLGMSALSWKAFVPQEVFLSMDSDVWAVASGTRSQNSLSQRILTWTSGIWLKLSSPLEWSWTMTQLMDFGSLGTLSLPPRETEIEWIIALKYSLENKTPTP